MAKPFKPTQDVLHCFEEDWCDHCRHDRLFRAGTGRGCGIHDRGVFFEIGDSRFPAEWVEMEDGEPRCEAYLSNDHKPELGKMLQQEVYKNRTSGQMAGSEVPKAVDGRQQTLFER